MIVVRCLLLTSMVLATGISAGQPLLAQQAKLVYAPAPVANPLKGLVPYEGIPEGQFPHTMEFSYVSFGSLVKGYDQFDWAPLEGLLNRVASRGHQTIFRVYLEYPGKLGILPQFLINDGLVVHKYVNTNTAPLPPTEIETPDYRNPNLRRAMKNFLQALGRKYDGDPRIGFITAGMLGTWGEWHNYPRDELFASKTVQAEVLDAYAAAFKKTPILLRYPANASSGTYVDNTSRPFGYHDDSFAWATLITGKPNDSWFFLSRMQTAGPVAQVKWRTQPIGGEIRPEAWGKVFDLVPGDPKIQDFRKCVEQTHCTWLMDSGMFESQQSPQRVERAEAEVRRMGYEFHVPSVEAQPMGSSKFTVKLEVQNKGIAPFYAAWPIQYGVISNGRVQKVFAQTQTLQGIQPSAWAQWQHAVDLTGLPPGKYRLALRVPNPLPRGLPVRFANREQDQHAPGWLSLVELAL